MKRLMAIALALALMVLAGCSGTASKPTTLTIGFVPSSNATGIETNVKPMEDYLTKALGMPVKTFVGTNYISVIEGMGSKTIDAAFLNTFGYVVAHDDYSAQLILKTQRSGSGEYRAQLNVRTADNIPVCDTAKDKKCSATFNALKGKKMAFVDRVSTSGYLFPANFMKASGYDFEKGQWFADVIDAGSHDSGIKSVYNKVVDASWSFDDARGNLEKELPDVKQKVAVAMYIDHIPNDTVTVRKGLPTDFTAQLKKALTDFSKTDEGKSVLKKLYSIDGFTDGADKDYQIVRDTAKNLGIDMKAKLGKK